MKSNKRNAVLLIILVVAAFAASKFTLQQLTIFSLSKVEVDPTNGEIIGDKLKGTYWVVTVSLDSVDKYIGNKLEIIEEGQEGEFQGETVEARKNLEIQIKPYQAFFYRDILLEDTTITMRAYKSIRNKATYQVSYDKDVYAPVLTSGHYKFDIDLWKAETKFEVNAWLKDVKIADGKVMDTHAGETDFSIDTSHGAILFKSLGGLTGGWEDPDVGKLLIWNENYIYEYRDAIKRVRYDSGGILRDWKTYDTEVQILEGHDYPYSVYWYGEMRWSEKVSVIPDGDVRYTPAGFKKPQPGWISLHCVDPDDYGGWIADDGLVEQTRIPIEPVIFFEDKDELPSDKRGFYCVTQFLEDIADIPNMGRKGDQADRVFKGYESWEIVDLEEGEDKKQVRVYMPWAVYEIPVIEILVPVELVDTWVWSPPVADLKIIDTGWLSATGDHMDIPAEGVRTCWIEVKQFASDEATGKIEATTSIPGKASINPSIEQPTIAPGETKRFYFEVTNTGTSSDTIGRVKFTCKEMLTGSQTDYNDDLSFTVKKGGGGGDTILDVIVVDDETGDPVSGINVFVSTGGDVDEDTTDLYGQCSFNLGAYEGKATISTGETDTYKKATRSVTLRSGTQEKFIRLVKHGEEPDNIPWEYIAIIAVAVVAVVAIFVKRR